LSCEAPHHKDLFVITGTDTMFVCNGAGEWIFRGRRPRMLVLPQHYKLAYEVRMCVRTLLRSRNAGHVIAGHTCVLERYGDVVVCANFRKVFKCVAHTWQLAV